MKIAVTHQNGMVFQHFGHCPQFKIYEIKEGCIASTELVDASGSGHGALAGFLKEHDVDAVICGGIGGGAINALAMAGIRVFPGALGGADNCVEALLAGELVYNPEATCGHHHGGDHECGHHHGEDHECGGHHDHGCGSHGCH